MDHPPRQSHQAQCRRVEGRRTPGVFRFARHHHVGALFLGAATAGPRRGEAACEPGVSCDPVFVRASDSREAGELPRLQGRAILSVADQGRRRRRFLDRLGGARVAQTLFASLVQDYVKAHGWAKNRPEGRMIAVVGDAEMDEGNIFEALLEGWKHGLRNTWWVIDYNRQSLDAVVREGLWEKFESMFRNFGWDVVIVKYGRLMRAAFAEPGGEALRRWIDACPNQMYAALCFQGGAAFRRHLRDEIGDQGEVSQIIERRSDEELLALMSNLGGHDMASMCEAFESIDHDRPVCFIAYTIKGVGLPFQGHKDNHAGLMTVAQMEKWRGTQNIRPGHEWDKFEGLAQDPAKLEAFLAQAPFNREGRRRLTAPAIDVPQQLSFKPSAQMSTQQGFGLVLNELARGDSELASRIVTASPDVTVSTNLGAWVNRRGLFARAEK